MDEALSGRTRGPNTWQMTAKANNSKTKGPNQKTAILKVINISEARAMERFRSTFLCIGKRLIQVYKFQSEDLKMNLFLWIKRLGI